MCQNESLDAQSQIMTNLLVQEPLESILNKSSPDTFKINLEIFGVRETHYRGGNVVLHDGKSRRRSNLTNSQCCALPPIRWFFTFCGGASFLILTVVSKPKWAMVHKITFGYAWVKTTLPPPMIGSELALHLQCRINAKASLVARLKQSKHSHWTVGEIVISP